MYLAGPDGGARSPTCDQVAGNENGFAFWKKRVLVNVVYVLVNMAYVLVNVLPSKADS